MTPGREDEIWMEMEKQKGWRGQDKHVLFSTEHISRTLRVNF